MIARTGSMRVRMRSAMSDTAESVMSFGMEGSPAITMFVASDATTTIAPL
jgi:hypothetical protein